MGGKKEYEGRDERPGPGQYDPDVSATRYNSPAVKISNSRTGSPSEGRFQMSQEKLSMPGPGTYDQPSSIGKGPAVSIRGVGSTTDANGRSTFNP